MKALPLAGLQQLFQGHVQSGGVADAPMLQALVTANERGSATDRVAVYVEAYRLRLTEALSTDYPALRAVLGVPEFEHLCSAYIAAHPSTTPSIRWLGRHMHTYLASAPDYAARPVLAELALFEWKQGETFDSPDAAPLSIEQVAAIPPAAWPGMHLLLHPSVRRLALRGNAPAIVVAVNAKRKRPALRQSALPTAWLMWRDAALDIRWRSMNADEAAAFDAVAGNRSFAELCELLCDFTEPEQAPMQAAGLLKRWIIDGLITDFDLSA